MNIVPPKLKLSRMWTSFPFQRQKLSNFPLRLKQVTLSLQEQYKNYTIVRQNNKLNILAFVTIFLTFLCREILLWCQFSP